METTDYVSYELAKKLKACGFDEPCGKGVKIIPGTEREEWDEEEWQWCTVKDIEYYPKITLWQAHKWLREKKGIAINVIAHDGGKYSNERVYLPNYDESATQWATWHINHTPLFDTYEEALSAGITEILRLLVGKESEQS